MNEGYMCFFFPTHSLRHDGFADVLSDFHGRGKKHPKKVCYCIALTVMPFFDAPTAFTSHVRSANNSTALSAFVNMWFSM